MSGGVWRLIRSLKLRALGPEKQRVGTDYLGNTYYRIPKHKTWAGYPSVQACRLPCYFSPCSSSVYQGANFAAGRRGHLGTIISTAPPADQVDLKEPAPCPSTPDSTPIEPAPQLPKKPLIPKPIDQPLLQPAQPAPVLSDQEIQPHIAFQSVDSPVFQLVSNSVLSTKGQENTEDVCMRHPLLS
ncbi:NADH dehydrogenase [ubiquinone] 1 alpha subcomplex assembly factor 2 isoform X2 [Hemicordylus capensis]|uniref:NADH dehydrogenase [ubiquinone] 1 alpha subcomplex assembly factor 2 isoform X2 n=1 Tax=Hemicordylus capensis TaxID=884348 RepID=UPI002302DFDC|nr:NADH dehydrogenase [ubiquinone] 1 alpha subcomplex assembly factor 2 isoform X2 [Hemicordylus capensis]XP_053149025.1 NADH dehydrogenase [ubiquinone] 1 alpha subcomplex assembly factor 2 isoform X2 [Hemicordylus capensis]